MGGFGSKMANGGWPAFGDPFVRELIFGSKTANGGWPAFGDPFARELIFGSKTANRVGPPLATLLREIHRGKVKLSRSRG